MHGLIPVLQIVKWNWQYRWSLMFILVKPPNMLSISHFNTGTSWTDLFPVPFCICLEASAHEQYSTPLLFPVLTGSIHYIPLIHIPSLYSSMFLKCLSGTFSLFMWPHSWLWHLGSLYYHPLVWIDVHALTLSSCNLALWNTLIFTCLHI